MSENISHAGKTNDNGLDSSVESGHQNSSFTRAEKAALRLIARAEQNSCALARKLERRGFDAACIGSVIALLLEKGLVDDSRYARLWMESSLRLTRSPRRLLAAICGKGINRSIAEDALNSVLDEDIELALLERFVKKYSRKASRRQKGTDSSALKYLLKSEGFSSSAIQQFMEKYAPAL